MKCQRVWTAAQTAPPGSRYQTLDRLFQISLLPMNDDVLDGTMAGRMKAWVEDVQLRIVRALEDVDGGATFRRDAWTRSGGGGGLTMVIEDGAVFEKGGVNTSAVHGDLPEATARLLGVDPAPFFATGVSLVIHPRSPHVPTVHANFRYFAIGHDLKQPVDFWFGGGADLTPYYPRLEDVRHFHQTWKDVCDRHGIIEYDDLRRRCDEYFFLPHRGEARGVGGIFYDYLRGDADAAYAFTEDAGDHFVDAYLPIVERRKEQEYSQRERDFQNWRRGRYVEFNLLFDRGTRFGIQTDGRTESILMSLPPQVEWRYDWVPEAGSPEAEAMRFLAPHDWLRGEAPGEGSAD